jgi:hypothetical protein
MDMIIFMLRYVPFWAVPLALISGEFAYIFWLKSMKRISSFFVVIFVFSVIFIGYYYYAGSPENSARIFLKFIYSNS